MGTSREVLFCGKLDVCATARAELRAWPLRGRAAGTDFELFRFGDERAAFRAARSGCSFRAAFLAITAERHQQCAFTMRRGLAVISDPGANPEKERNHNTDQDCKKNDAPTRREDEQSIEDRV